MNRPEIAVVAFRCAQELRADLRSYQGIFRREHLVGQCFTNCNSKCAYFDCFLPLLLRSGSLLFGKFKGKRGSACCKRGNEGHASVSKGFEIGRRCAC